MLWPKNKRNSLPFILGLPDKGRSIKRLVFFNSFKVSSLGPSNRSKSLTRFVTLAKSFYDLHTTHGGKYIAFKSRNQIILWLQYL